MSDTGKPHQNTKTAFICYSCSVFDTHCNVIVLLSQYVGNLKNPSNSSDAYTEDKILERIAPIGSIRTEPVLADSSATSKRCKHY